MSSTIPPRMLPENYTSTGRYWKAAQDWFDVVLTEEQRQICEAIKLNQYVHVEGANGFGKTFGTVALALAFWARHHPCSVVVTSGTYGKLKRTFCADAEKLHQKFGLFGEWKWSPNPHIDVEGSPDWQFEIISPEDPGELEGVHNEHTLVIVDEADKKDVGLGTMDSLDSLISDDNDKMLVLSNPPEDETNSIERMSEIGIEPVKMNFSTFQSHNVLVEMGEREGEQIPGLATLNRLKTKWESYNGIEWPGFEEARDMSDPSSPRFRDDLSSIWYRRFAGIKPPAGASVNKPFTLHDVDEAYDPDATTGECRGSGIDVARSNDRTVMVQELGGHLGVAYSQPGTDHTVQFERIWDRLDASGQNEWISIDAVGEGSGKADDTANRYDEVHRFKSGQNAVQEDEYKDRWTEGLCELGKWMKRGGTFGDSKLQLELQTAARVLELDEKFYQSRKDQVYVASKKDKVKAKLGHSPDYLDAAIQAVLAAEDIMPDKQIEIDDLGWGT